MLGLKRASNRHVGGKFELELELALAQDRTGQDRTGQDRTGQDRQDLCDRLEARNGLRERDRWKVLYCII